MRPMRKASRQKSAEWALEVFDKAPFVTVSMTRPDGTPYGLPLSLVRRDKETFYFHCAGEGEKIDCLRANPVVSLSAVSKCTPEFGRAETGTDTAEKTEALRLLCQRFLPKYMNHFEEAINRSLDRTTVIKITLTEPPVGKSKQ